MSLSIALQVVMLSSFHSDVQNDYTFVIYSVALWTYIIPNDSDSVWLFKPRENRHCIQSNFAFHFTACLTPGKTTWYVSDWESKMVNLTKNYLRKMFTHFSRQVYFHEQWWMLTFRHHQTTYFVFIVQAERHLWAVSTCCSFQCKNLSSWSIWRA